MKVIKLWILMIAAVVLCNACACTTGTRGKYPQQPNFTKQTLQEEYESGKMLVLFAYKQGIGRSEALADWQAYLEDFKKDFMHKVYVSNVHTKDIANLKVDSLEYTLFLRDGFPAYIYRGLILEPQVYMAVYKKFHSQRLDDVDRAFLPEEYVF